MAGESEGKNPDDAKARSNTKRGRGESPDAIFTEFDDYEIATDAEFCASDELLAREHRNKLRRERYKAKKSPPER